MTSTMEIPNTVRRTWYRTLLLLLRCKSKRCVSSLTIFDLVLATTYQQFSSALRAPLRRGFALDAVSFPRHSQRAFRQLSSVFSSVQFQGGLSMKKIRCRLCNRQLESNSIASHFSDIQDNSYIRFFTFPSEQDAGSSWRFLLWVMSWRRFF
jgi:hypothetical protein